MLLLIPILNFAQPVNWISKGIGGGGALFSPSISPHNTNRAFVACDMSALYETTNFGETWNMQSHTKIQANRSSKVCFTSNSSVMYTIDYTLQSGSDAARPVKSSDGGQTWQSLADPTGSDCWSVYADYNDPQRIIVSDYSNVWLSVDGGSHFNLKITSNVNGAGCHITGTFFDGTTIYIATNAGLYISTNNGNSFAVGSMTGINTGESMISFCAAKSGSTSRFYCITQNTGDVYAGIAGDSWDGFQDMYTMVPGQSQWTSIASGIPSGIKPFFARCAMNDINTVYVAGSDENNNSPAVCKSTNAGTAWTNVFLPSMNTNIYTGWCGDGGDRGWGYAELAFGFDVSPLDATKAAFTDYGFIHLTDNGGTTWKQGYVNSAYQNSPGANTPSFKSYAGNGLENTSCWNLCWGNSQKMFAGYSDIRGTQSSDAGATWRMTSATTQNTTYRFIKSPANSNIYAATSTAHDIYQTTYLTDARLDVAFGGINFSIDNGSSWQTLHNFNHPVVWMCIDPNNTNTMYASVIHYAGGIGEGGIWKTDNLQAGSASVWTKLNNPVRTEGHPFNVHVLNDGSIVASYCGRRNSSGTFTASSGIYILSSGSSTWIDRSSSGMQYYTKDVIIDPHDATQNTWYACVWSGWGGAPNGLGGLYKTTDRGVNWTRIFSGADRVSSITINPASATEAWLTTETEGLWHTSNFNAVTPLFTQNTNFPFRQPERVFYNPYNNSNVWVTTFGGGIWEGSSITGIEKQEVKSDVFVIYPNPASGNEIQLTSSTDGVLTLTSATGELCYKQSVVAGINAVKHKLKPGVYIAGISSVNGITTSKLIIY